MCCRALRAVRCAAHHAWWNTVPVPAAQLLILQCQTALTSSKANPSTSIAPVDNVAVVLEGRSHTFSAGSWIVASVSASSTCSYLLTKHV